MNSLQCISGRNKGTHLYVFGGKAYFVRQRQGKKTYLVCKEKRRGCNAWLRADDNDGTVKLLRGHDELACNTNQEAINVLVAKDDMKNAAEKSSPGTSLREIFSTTAQQHGVSANVSYHDMENAMRKRRRLSMPPIPSSAEEAVEALEKVPDNFKRYLRHSINSDSGQAFVFYSDRARRAVQEHKVEFLQADATFYVCPSIFAQFFTVMAEIENHMFPVGFALMSSRRQNLYVGVVEELKQGLWGGGGDDSSSAEQQVDEPTRAITDFEPAIARALEINFPEITVHGCSFHFAQTIHGQIKKTGLIRLFHRDQKFRQWACKVMALPLLPEDQLAQVYGDELAKESFSCARDEKTAIVELKKYIKRRWIRKVRPAKLSVFEVQRRTNNDLESFHRWLRRCIPAAGAKCNVWTFVDRLNALMEEVDTDFERLSNGLKVRRPKSKVRREAEAKLQELKQALAEGRISAIEFLEQAKSKVRLPQASPEEASSALEGREESSSSGGEDTDDSDDEEKENAGSAQKCLTCSSRPVGAILIPCGHAKLCKDCAEKASACPFCQEPVAQSLEIIF